MLHVPIGPGYSSTACYLERVETNFSNSAAKCGLAFSAELAVFSPDSYGENKCPTRQIIPVMMDVCKQNPLPGK